MKRQHIVTPRLALRTISAITNYVHEALDRLQSDKVAIYMPNLSDGVLDKLHYYFITVERESFGYVQFGRIDT